MTLARWGALAALLLAEGAYLTLKFDAVPRLADPSWGSRFLGYSPNLLRIALSAALVGVALAGWRLRDELGRLAREVGPLTNAWPWLLGHLIAFLLFARSTASVLAAGGAPPSWAESLAWVGWGLLAAVCWAAATVPPRFWPRLARRGGGVALAAVAIAVAGWAAGVAVWQGWEWSARPTFWATYHLLSLVCPEVVCRPEQFVLGTPAFRVKIAAACSGYEGVGLISVFLGAYLWVFRRDHRFPRALLLLPVGAALMWATNAVRIFALVLIGDQISPELALGGFHSQAGWLAFNAVALGLVYCAHRFRWFAAATKEWPARAASAKSLAERAGHSLGAVNPTAAYLAPLLAVVATQMLTVALFNGSPALYPLRVAAAVATLGYFWRYYGPLWRPEPTSLGWTGPHSRGWFAELYATGWAAAAGAAVFAVWMAPGPLAPPAGTGDAAALAGAPAWAVTLWLCSRAVGSVVTVPLVEELAFRGYLSRRLVSADFEKVSLARLTWFSLLLSSLLFGLLHGRWLAGTLAGLTYALVLCRRGRLADAVLAHAVTNAMITAHVLTTGQWQSWS